MKRQALVALVAFVVALGASSQATADTPQERAVRISRNVMSPFCPGSTLHDCPSVEAVELRDEIASWAAGGMTDEAIYERLEDEYGTTVRALPDGGQRFAVWYLPVAAGLAGVTLVVLSARRWVRRSPADTKVELAEEDRVRVEAELDDLRQQHWGPA